MFVIPFFAISIGLLSYGFMIYFLAISPLEPFPFTSTEGIMAIITMTIGGLLVAFLGIYLRPKFQKKMEARRLEKILQEEAEADSIKNGQPVYRKVKY
jgi:putative membrane protein